MKKNNPLISIIIPIYNVENYIIRCINSIKQQTYNNFEVIMIDDGSTDKTYEICKNEILNDERFLLHKKKNTGVSDTRNKALELTRGEYITFIDADDWVDKNYIKKLYETLKNYNLNVVASNFYISNGSKHKKQFYINKKIIKKECILNPYSKYSYSSVWGKMFSKKVIKDKRFCIDIFYSEDTLFYIDIVKEEDNIAWISEPLYYYYDNNSGAMKSKNPQKFFTDFIARKRILLKYQNESKFLQKMANFKVTDSAINIKKQFLKQKFEDKKMMLELDKWIEENGKLYLFSFNIRLKDKIIYLIIKNKVLLSILMK